MILAAEAKSPDGTLLGFLIEAIEKDRASYLSALMRVLPVQDLYPQARTYGYSSKDSFYENEED